MAIKSVDPSNSLVNQTKVQRCIGLTLNKKRFKITIINKKEKEYRKQNLSTTFAINNMIKRYIDFSMISKKKFLNGFKGLKSVKSSIQTFNRLEKWRKHN